MIDSEHQQKNNNYIQNSQRNYDIQIDVSDTKIFYLGRNNNKVEGKLPIYIYNRESER